MNTGGKEFTRKGQAFDAVRFITRGLRIKCTAACHEFASLWIVCASISQGVHFTF